MTHDTYNHLEPVDSEIAVPVADRKSSTAAEHGKLMWQVVKSRQKRFSMTTLITFNVDMVMEDLV
ncbi:hypothetical protein KIN20_030647 [Parelaphostrongylus tenuis]|uniref:Uncharacterized protein n=1 Tax=Parelaphostrongylus tenuis TaxID=148309 RepID=A0AAD5R4C9_PARTN|nr:hypothetical protein KIN20_030647 [Parelaphostrongylus tenuis]